MGKFYDALKKWQEESGSLQSEAPPREPSPPEPVPGLDGQLGAEPERVARPPRPEVWSPQDLAEIAGPHAKGRHGHLLISNGADPAVDEQYKMLRTQVLHYQNGNPPRTILVTSALQGEGKSTVAANLAISIAQSVEEHVLLMDCDLREPSLHRLFGLRPVRGLTDYLRREVELPELLLRTEIDKLSFLPAGPKSPHAAELLASDKMRSLMAEVKQRYDDRFIILDATPLLPAADPAILATQVDAILLVVRAGMANRELVARVIDTLGREKLLGVVFNCVEPRPMSYTYKYYRSAYSHRRA